MNGGPPPAWLVAALGLAIVVVGLELLVLVVALGR